MKVPTGVSQAPTQAPAMHSPVAIEKSAPCALHMISDPSALRYPSFRHAIFAIETCGHAFRYA
jgi:hypothetical protein